MEHGYITDWIANDIASEESLREASQFAERGCAEKEVTLVGVMYFHAPTQ